MRGEPADRADLAVDLALLPVDPDLLGARLKVRAQRALALVTDEQQDRVRVADEVAEMADDPPAGQHPVRGDDHVRPRGLLDRLRLLDLPRLNLVRVVERRLAAPEQGRGL